MQDIVRRFMNNQTPEAMRQCPNLSGTSESEVTEQLEQNFADPAATRLESKAKLHTSPIPSRAITLQEMVGHCCTGRSYRQNTAISRNGSMNTELSKKKATSDLARVPDRTP
jgi:hypothetical protein